LLMAVGLGLGFLLWLGGCGVGWLRGRSGTGCRGRCGCRVGLRGRQRGVLGLGSGTRWLGSGPLGLRRGTLGLRLGSRTLDFWAWGFGSRALDRRSGAVFRSWSGALDFGGRVRLLGCGS
jgi:hypothetical protein